MLAGLSGIVVFIPQIMILFGLINILEDSGYMARISFLTDKLMRKVGLNGKSVMPMISGFACAVPAIMSARNIENKKERLLNDTGYPADELQRKASCLHYPDQPGDTQDDVRRISRSAGTCNDGTLPARRGYGAGGFLCGQMVHPDQREKFLHP